MCLDIDTGYTCSLLIGTDCICELAIAGVTQRDVENDCHEQEHHDWPDACANEIEAVGQAGDRLTLRIPLGNAARGHHHAESGNEGRDFRAGDELPIDETGQHAGENADSKRDDERQVGEPGIKGQVEDCAMLADNIAVRPTTDPEDRSMPPVMMTCVTPTAMMPITETCRIMMVSRCWFIRKLWPMNIQPRIS